VICCDAASESRARDATQWQEKAILINLLLASAPVRLEKGNAMNCIQRQLSDRIDRTARATLPYRLVPSLHELDRSSGPQSVCRIEYMWPMFTRNQRFEMKRG
jgi:hypothetical protein